MKGDGEPLRIEYLRGLNYNGFESVLSQGIEKVRSEYETMYGEVGIAEFVWDEKAQKHRYTVVR